MQPPSRPGRPLAPFEPLAPLGPGDPQLIGGYRVLARLGAGRLGPVYLATTQSGRRLAIKTVRPEHAGDDAFRQRFKQEIAAAQRVRGPFLVAVVDGHAEGTSPWVASEYVPGPSLGRAADETGPLPAATVRALLGAVAEALQAIHDADLVHGGLKPSNVLLAEDGPHVAGHGSLEHGVGPAQDVLALGRLALFAATGLGPRDQDPAALTECPDELREPIGRCLAADPSERPEPRALVAELEEGAPGPGWLPSGIAALLPAYQDPPPRSQPAPLPSPKPTFEAPDEPVLGASGGQVGGPNFALPVEPPPSATGPMAVHGPPVMDSYRHDLAIALAIGAGAFGLLVLVLLFVFLM